MPRRLRASATRLRSATTRGTCTSSIPATDTSSRASTRPRAGSWAVLSSSAKTWSCRAKTARSRRTPCAPERNSRSRGAPMLPAVALVGRPNVGKSTLFNRLTRTRDALVADFPGLTRDRRYGIGERDGRRFIVIDTGGLAVGAEGDMTSLVAQQVDLAIEEANAVVLVVDHRSGLTPEDIRIAERLRRETDKVAA